MAALLIIIIIIIIIIMAGMAVVLKPDRKVSPI